MRRRSTKMKGKSMVAEWGAEIAEKCSATIVLENKNRILWNLRDDKPGIWAPNTWALIGGQVEPGESLLMAAMREVQEEVGLDIRQRERWNALWPILEYRGEAMQLSLVFGCCVDNTEADAVVCHEGREMKWMPLDVFTGRPLSYNGQRVVLAHHEAVVRWLALYDTRLKQ